MTTTEPASPLGRPREFDTDAVLDVVVDLFWEKGYGATSVGDIVERTGLSKSSIYGAFGSKDALYEKALDRYLVGHRQALEERLINGSRGLDDVDQFFDGVEDQVRQSETRGCLAVNTATELRTSEPVLVQLGARHRAAMREAFAAALTRAADLGEIEPHRVDDLANNLVTTALGFGVMVGGGASAEEVRAHLASVRASLRNP